MYRHNSVHNLWKELGKLAKKSRRWTTCKGELKNELCWLIGGTDVSESGQQKEKNKPKEYPQQPQTKTVAKHAMSMFIAPPFLL